MSTVPRLHTYFRSSCSYRVRIALNYKNIPYESVYVNLLKGEQKDPKYEAINSSKMTPALEIDGEILSQSMAIIEYLETTRPNETPLLRPNDPKLTAKIRQLSYIIACDTQPVTNLPLLQHAKRLGEAPDVWAITYMDRGFEAMEKLVPEGSKYLIDNSITLADICFMPQYYNAQRFGVDFNKYPKLRTVADHLITLDEFRKAHPHSQGDCPEDLAGKI